MDISFYSLNGSWLASLCVWWWPNINIDKYAWSLYKHHHIYSLVYHLCIQVTLCKYHFLNWKQMVNGETYISAHLLSQTEHVTPYFMVNFKDTTTIKACWLSMSIVCIAVCTLSKATLGGRRGQWPGLAMYHYQLYHLPSTQTGPRTAAGIVMDHF